MDWGQIFLPSVNVVETFVRGTVMFLAIFVIMRVAGQREGGAHSLTDLLVVVLVAEAAAHGMAGDATGIADSVLLIATIVGWSVALDVVAYRWPRIGDVIKSRPRPLIVDGRVNERALRREFMTRKELEGELRLHGIDDVRQVARAYLEPNGMISTIKMGGGGDEERPKPTIT